MNMGFYFNQARCIGCATCGVACKDWYDIPAGPAKWMRVTTSERGKFPNVVVTFLALACAHCGKPSCVPACPVSAITKRPEDGIVIVDRQICLGRDACGAPCFEACPYEAPQFGEEKNAKMQKCNLCLERWVQGQNPICVDACPTRALDAGPIDDLRAKYGDLKEIEGFKCAVDIQPSIVFKARL